jgi:hypothetical protein
MFSSIKLSKILLPLSTVGVAVLSTVTVVAPVQAVAIDFGSSPWGSTGNVTIPGIGSADLSTVDGADATGFPPELQNFLDLSTTDLDLSDFDTAFGGSALKRQVRAGDKISFAWTFALDPNFNADPFFPLPDYAFVVVDGAVEQLATSSSSGGFSRTFTSDGLFGIGVVDIGDAFGESILALTEGDFVPIPTPALLPGLFGLGVAALRKKREQA